MSFENSWNVFSFSFFITHFFESLNHQNWITKHELWSPNKMSSVGPINFGSWVMKTGSYHSKLTTSKHALNNSFSVFKQHYTFFRSHVFQKTTNNIAQTPLPNRPSGFPIQTPIIHLGFKHTKLILAQKLWNKNKWSLQLKLSHALYMPPNY